jgi:hypothetical protein
MNKLFKILLVALFAVVGFAIGGTALAGGNNEAQDDISAEKTQSGTSSSGDAVGGQVVGVVSAGDASVDSTNRSEDVDIETGEATATNDSDSFTGQFNDGSANNESQGDIESSVAQDASATSGDGVGGAVIGVVTSAGGSADVVAANTSEDVDIETGDAFADNLSDTFVGQEIDDDADNNESQGDIGLDAAQSATAASGDGVGGQVLGIVSAGDASVDATNETTDSDVETGDAFATNLLDSFVGQTTENDQNESQGDIESEVAQDASANSGDAVAGQVAGVVTSAGGSADLVLANTTEDVDAETGTSDFFNETDEFVGQQQNEIAG